MADETNTTETATSTETATTQTDAAATVTDGGTDAGTTSADDAGDDSTVVAGATEAGKGDAGEGGDKAGEGGDADDGDKGADAEGVPETYELTVKDAEGKDIPVDAGLLTEATPVLKELGLNNEAASKVAGLVPKMHDRFIRAQADEFGALSAQWAKDAKADPELGGKNWADTEHLVARAMDHFVGPLKVKNEAGEEVKHPFRQLIDDSKIGNHPDFIRAFRKIGEALGEDSTLARSGSSKAEKPPREEVMYPDDVPTKTT